MPDAGTFAAVLAGSRCRVARTEWPYESDWLGEVRTFGAEHYYPPLEA